MLDPQYHIRGFRAQEETFAYIEVIILNIYQELFCKYTMEFAFNLL
jgi:hypothetical protein